MKAWIDWESCQDSVSHGQVVFTQHGATYCMKVYISVL